MIYVVAKNSVKVDKIEDYIKLAKKLVEATNKFDEGCVEYELLQDINNTQIFTMIEQWESKEALDAHLSATHVQEILPLLRDLRDGAGDVNIYQKVE